MRRRRWVVLAVGLLVAAGGAWAFEGWRLRGELERARREVASGLWLSARPRLAMLAGRWPRDGEVLYHLGIAEMASGRPDRADEAWAKVPPGSAFAGRAALMRGARGAGGAKHRTYWPMPRRRSPRPSTSRGRGGSRPSRRSSSSTRSRGGSTRPDGS